MTNGLRFDFGGTSVLVTGGTSGIGHAIASAFARSGADVVVTGTRPDAGHYDIDLSSFSYRPLDVRDHGAVEELAATVDLWTCWSTTPGPTSPTGGTSGTPTASPPHSTSTWRAPCA